jgi:glycosyltransferase involved in cell wall biosynthesis
LVIVNDGSSYGVNEEVVKYISENHQNFKFISLKENRGKGFALRTGIENATGGYFIFTDIDFPYTRQSFKSILNGFEKGGNLIVGNRGQDYYKNTPIFRKLLSKSLRRIMKTFLKLPVDDTQCGIKGFDEKGKEVFLITKIDRFLFDLEFIKLSSKKGLIVSSEKVQLKDGVVFSKIKFSILFRESINFIRILFRK